MIIVRIRSHNLGAGVELWAEVDDVRMCWGIPGLLEMATRPRAVKAALRPFPLPAHRLSKCKTFRIKPLPGVRCSGQFWWSRGVSDHRVEYLCSAPDMLGTLWSHRACHRLSASVGVLNWWSVEPSVNGRS